MSSNNIFQLLGKKTSVPRKKKGVTIKSTKKKKTKIVDMTSKGFDLNTLKGRIIERKKKYTTW